LLSINFISFQFFIVSLVGFSLNSTKRLKCYRHRTQLTAGYSRNRQKPARKPSQNIPTVTDFPVCNFVQTPSGPR